MHVKQEFGLFLDWVLWVSVTGGLLTGSALPVNLGGEPAMTPRKLVLLSVLSLYAFVLCSLNAQDAIQEPQSQQDNDTLDVGYGSEVHEEKRPKLNQNNSANSGANATER